MKNYDIYEVSCFPRQHGQHAPRECLLEFGAEEMGQAAGKWVG